MTIKQIIQAVSSASGVSEKDILSDRRIFEISLARATVCWLAAQNGFRNKSAIARSMNVDPGTVCRAVNRVEAQRSIYRDVQDLIEKSQQMLAKQ